MSSSRNQPDTLGRLNRLMPRRRSVTVVAALAVAGFAALPAGAALAVGTTAQSITFTSSPPTHSEVGDTYTVTATASSGLAVAFTTATPGDCTVTGSTVTSTTTGPCTINANQSGDATYAAAPQAQQSFLIKTAQTIVLAATGPAGTVDGPPYTVSASTTGPNSGNPLVFSADTPAICSVGAPTTALSATVHFLAVGTCVIDANQPGTGTYWAADQKQQSVTVNQGGQTITFTNAPPTTAQAQVGSPSYTNTATATSGLTVTFSTPTAASICTVSGSGVMTFDGKGVCAVKADQAGNASYAAAPTTTRNITIGNQVITISSSAPANAFVGGPGYTIVASSTSGNPVTFSSATPSVCTVTAGGAASFVGKGTCTLQADAAGDATHFPAPPKTQSFPVGVQSIKFTSTPPANAQVGVGSYQASAVGGGSGNPVTFSSDTPGVCAVSGTGTVTFSAKGTCTVDANQAGNANWDPAPQEQQSFVIGKQVITFTTTPPPNAAVGGPAYTVAASAPGGTVTFTNDASSTGCTFTSPATFNLTAPGTCVIDANQGGDPTHFPAPQAQQSFTIGGQTITLTSTVPNPAVVGGKYVASGTGGASGNPVTFSTNDNSICTAGAPTTSTSAQVSFIDVGNCVVTANQAGNGTYAAAPPKTQSFAITAPAPVTITSAAPAATVAGPTYALTATGNGSSAPIVFATSTAPCTVTGSVVSFNSAGTCTITATQAGDANYPPAAAGSQTFTVGKGSQTLTFTSNAPTDAHSGGPVYTVTATATSHLTPIFSADATSTGCTVSGATVTFTTAGTCVVNANQPGDANYTAAAQKQQIIGVNKTAQAITFTSTPPNPAHVGDSSYTVTATGGGSGNAVTFAIDSLSAGVCSISGSSVSILANGICRIDANQAGSNGYAPAPQVQQVFGIDGGSSALYPSPVLSEISGKGNVLLQVDVDSRYNGYTVIYFVRSGITGVVRPLGTSTVDSQGVTQRFLQMKAGQILAIYAKLLGTTDNEYPYSNDVRFKVKP